MLSLQDSSLNRGREDNNINDHYLCPFGSFRVLLEGFIIAAESISLLANYLH